MLRTLRQSSGNVVGGSIALTFVPPSGYYWNVHHIAISNNGSAGGSAVVNLDNQFICGSNNATSDSADGTPIAVYDGSVLQIIFSNMGQASPLQANGLMIVDELLRGTSG